MVSLQELLRRFRHAWAPPGPALARAATPVDVAARLRAELEPVLAAIAEIQQRAEALRAEGEERAGELLDRATRDAEQAVRKAEREAPLARAAAVETTHRGVEAEITSAVAQGRAEADRIATQTNERLPELLTAIRECVQKGAVNP